MSMSRPVLNILLDIEDTEDQLAKLKINGNENRRFRDYSDLIGRVNLHLAGIYNRGGVEATMNAKSDLYQRLSGALLVYDKTTEAGAFASQLYARDKYDISGIEEAVRKFLYLASNDYNKALADYKNHLQNEEKRIMDAITPNDHETLLKVLDDAKKILEKMKLEFIGEMRKKYGIADEDKTQIIDDNIQKLSEKEKAMLAQFESLIKKINETVSLWYRKTQFESATIETLSACYNRFNVESEVVTRKEDLGFFKRLTLPASSPNEEKPAKIPAIVKYLNEQGLSDFLQSRYTAERAVEIIHDYIAHLLSPSKLKNIEDIQSRCKESSEHKENSNDPYLVKISFEDKEGKMYYRINPKSISKDDFKKDYNFDKLTLMIDLLDDIVRGRTENNWKPFIAHTKSKHKALDSVLSKHSHYTHNTESENVSRKLYQEGARVEATVNAMNSMQAMKIGKTLGNH